MRIIEPVSGRLERACTDGTSTGAAMQVYFRGEAVHTSAHGTTCDLLNDRCETLSTDSVFDVASLTKVMATTAVAMVFHSQRMLDPDKALSYYFPKYHRSLVDDNDKTSIALAKTDIKVADLLAHRAGLVPFRCFWERASLTPESAPIFQGPSTRPEKMGLSAAFEFSRKLTLQEVLAEEPEYEPGTRAVYSDTGFIVLAALLEAIGGAGLNKLFDELVVAPLGMKNTFFVDERVDQPGPAASYVATGYCQTRNQESLFGEVHDDNAFALAGVAGHAGLFSTVCDVARFGEAVRRAYKSESVGFFKPDTIRLFLQVDRSTPGSTRAYGFDTRSGEISSAGTLLNKSTTFGHLGFTGCSLWVDLSSDITLSLMTNRVYMDTEPLKIKSLRAETHDLVVSSLLESNKEL